MLVHRKDNRKRKSRRKSLFSKESHFHKNLSQNSLNGLRREDIEKRVKKTFSER